MIDLTLKNANILIVDDQEANIDVLEGLLQKQGYTNITTTTDPRDVIQLYVSSEPDLILLDLSMPYLSGFEVMEQLQSILPENTFLPILILTADVTTDAKQRALAAGASDFLTKPFDLIEVGLRIRNLLFSSYLQQQLQNQNQILEVKVAERTAELKKANAELIIARDKAQASDRLKTAFMHNISHEIRTPLNGILGFGALLAEEDISVAEKQEFLSLLYNSSNRLINTVTDYLDISLIVSANMEVNNRDVNITEELDQIKNKCQGLRGKKEIEFNLVTPVGDASFAIQTDPELFRKILIHLLDNAFKFTHQGFISFGYTANATDVEFFVKDSGIGIERKDQERIFEKFTQGDISTTRSYEGTGLGLSIIQGLLDLLGGNIRIESELGKGSAVFFTLPIDKGIVSNPENPDINLKTSAGRPPVLLIVDDDYTQRYYMESIFRNPVTTIYQAKNGQEAIDQCHAHPDISIVLMDMKMPVMDGYEATRQIRLFRNEIIIIAITAFAMVGDRQKVLDAGCDDYLSKPGTKHEFLEKLRNYGIPV